MAASKIPIARFVVIKTRELVSTLSNSTKFWFHGTGIFLANGQVDAIHNTLLIIAAFTLGLRTKREWSNYLSASGINARNKVATEILFGSVVFLFNQISKDNCENDLVDRSSFLSGIV
jgi:hypothetical protein